MGGGGLVQIVANGAQDIYLTGSPQITYWKTIFRRHTLFAIESIEQTFSGTVGFGKKVNTTISRNGDLITDVFLEITMKRNTANGTPYYPAEALLADVELEVGGQRIDKHYADWYRIYDSLFRKDDEREQYKRLTNFHENDANGAVRRFYVPLIFFFNRSPGLALPLIALQYHEVRLWFNFSPASYVMGVDGSDNNLTVQCFVDYVYLDVEERRRFAQVSHEYLIHQLQFTGDESITPGASVVNKGQKIVFNHPCKYIAWVLKNPAFHGQYIGLDTNENQYMDTANVYNEALGPLNSAKLVLNGHDRFSERRGSYFNKVVPWQTLRGRVPAGVYLYSFALKPDEFQPSGTCNFSRIDHAELRMSVKKANVLSVKAAQVITEDETVGGATNLTQLKIFAENYNVFRIMSGMGGLAYSN
jgi:hypothetical protein